MSHTTGDKPNWRNLFLGREQDMDFLRGVWQRVQDGHPQFVLLIGESGFGKTRLIQEFYCWLRKEKDPNDYWSDWHNGEVGSLEINPTFKPYDKTAGKRFPWLWWGLRWNISAMSNCALLGSEKNLLCHLDYLERDREDLKLFKELALDLLDPLEWFVAAKSLKKVIEAGVKVYANHNRSQMNIHALQMVERASLSKRLQSLIASVLKPVKKSGGSPFILVLDDAQWAEGDEESLSFLSDLCQSAWKNNLPLLVIATYREQEWNQHWDADCEATAGVLSKNLANILYKLRKTEDAKQRNLGFDFIERRLGRIPDLGEIAQGALPGLSQEDRKLILDTVDGNPKYLFDLLNELVQRHELFIGDDVKSQFTSDTRIKWAAGNLRIRHLEVLEDRFLKLTKGIQDALGWGSYQGHQFLDEFCVDMAVRLNPTEKNIAEQVREAIRQAAHPHTVVEHPKQGASEFCHRRYFQLARDYLKAREPDSACLTKAFLESVGDWIQPRRLNNLGLDEREIFLNLVIEQLAKFDALPKPDSFFANSLDRLRLQAVSSLIELYLKAGIFGKVDPLARQLVQSPYPVGGWPADYIPYCTQYSVLMALIELNLLSFAKPWAETLLRQTREEYETTPNEASAVNFFGGLDSCGLVSLQLGDLEAAIGPVEELVQLCEKAAPTFGDVQLALQYELYGRGRLLGVLCRLGNLTLAKTCCEQIVIASQRYREVVGDTTRALQNEASTLECMAALESQQGFQSNARHHLEQALHHWQALHLRQEATMRSLRREASCFLMLGQQDRDNGRFESAGINIGRANKIYGELRKQFGDSPQTLLETANGLRDEGHLAVKCGNNNQAHNFYNQAIELNRRSRQSFGDSKTQLKQEIMDLLAEGDLAQDEENITYAYKCFSRMLNISQQQRHQFGDIPETLCSEMKALYKLGAIKCRSVIEEDVTQGIQLFREAIKLGQIMRESFTDNTEAQLWEALCHQELGSANSDRGDLAEGMAHFEKALELVSRLNTQCPDDPKGLFCEVCCRMSIALYADVGEEVGSNGYHSAQESLTLFLKLKAAHPEYINSSQECKKTKKIFELFLKSPAKPGSDYERNKCVELFQQL